MASKKPDAVEAREAKHGQKMIEVKVRFWTDDMAEVPGTILPKHAWTSGVVRVERNPTHGIVPDSPEPFNSLLGLGAAIEEVLIRQGITLHPGRKDKQYLQDKAAANWKKRRKSAV